MDNTIDRSLFTKVFEFKQGWIGSLGGKEYIAYYLIVQDQRAVSNEIAIDISKHDADRIIASGGDPDVVTPVARNLSNGYLYVV